MKKMEYIGKSIIGIFEGAESLTNGKTYKIIEELRNGCYKLYDDNNKLVTINIEKFSELPTNEVN